MLVTLDHVLVAVRDLEAATESYTALLGRSPSWRGTHPDAGSANTLFRLDNVYLELITPRGEGDTGRWLERHLDTRGEGTLGMAFGTDDAEDCAAWLRERGLPAGDPTPGEGKDEVRGALRRWRNTSIPLEATRGVLMFAIEHESDPEMLPAAEPLHGRDAIVSGLDHIVVSTPDPEAAIDLYGRKLGLRLALDRSFPERGVRLLFFRISGVTVELAARLKPADGPTDRDRLGGLAYRVHDADAARARLAEAGFDVSEVRPGNKPGTYVCSVRDRTCGVPTLLIQPV